MYRELQLQVVDTALDSKHPGKPQVTFRSRQRTEAFRVRLYVTGPHLPYVKAVTYRLHSTFPNPIRRVERSPSNQTCELVIWAWGTFEVGVTVEDLEGHLYDMRHPMTFASELTKDVEYVEDDSSDPVRPRLRSAATSS